MLLNKQLRPVAGCRLRSKQTVSSLPLRSTYVKALGRYRSQSNLNLVSSAFIGSAQPDTEEQRSPLDAPQVRMGKHTPTASSQHLQTLFNTILRCNISYLPVLRSMQRVCDLNNSIDAYGSWEHIGHVLTLFSWTRTAK